MKKKLFFLFAFLLACASSWAENIQVLTANGWKPVTDITKMAVTDYYFVFVDGVDMKYSLGCGNEATSKPAHHNLGNPLADAEQVWILEGSGTTYKMKNFATGKYYNAGNEGWDNNMGDGGSDFSFELEGDKYHLKSPKDYLGPWNNNGKVTLDNAKEDAACNKSKAQSTGYYVFAMKRSVFDASRINKGLLESQGWTKAGKDFNFSTIAGDDYYVIFLNTTGLEPENGCGKVMARTKSGRPATMSLDNPFGNMGVLWQLTQKESEAQFALKNVDGGKYFRNQGWNTSFGDLNDDAYRKIVSSGDEGVYSIQNVANNDYVGHWNNDNKIAPREEEDIAANKNNDNKGYFAIYYMSVADYNTKRLAALATDVAPGTNLTQFIYNPRFSNNSFSPWEITGTSRNQQHHAYAAEWWNNSSLMFTQTLKNLPAGKYTLEAQAVNPINGAPHAFLHANDAEKSITASVAEKDYATVSGMLQKDPNLGETSMTATVGEDGILVLGVHDPAGWVIFDNFRLYKGARLQNEAVALPENGEMEAGKWYYFDIQAETDYTLTATTLADLVYANDGLSFLDTNSGTACQEKMTLPAGRYYVKSASANKLVVAPFADVYKVGEPTFAKEGKYIQNGQKLTVTFDEAVTTDAEATLALKEAKITVNGQEVDVRATEKGFTFDVALEPATDYTATIPAGIYGYQDKDMNKEAKLTWHTPAVMDCNVYFKNTDGGYADKPYLTRGSTWGTQCVVNEAGLAIKIRTDEDGKTQLRFVDSNLNLGDDAFMYGDCGDTRVRTFTVTKVENGYKFLNQNNKKYMALYQGSLVGDAVEGGNLEGQTNVWQLVSAADYLKEVAALEDAKATQAAQASGLQAKGKAQLEEQLAAGYKAQVVDKNNTGTFAESFQKNASNAEGSQPHESVKKTVENVQPGLYKLTVHAYDRATKYEDATYAADGSRGAAYVYVGDVKMQLKSPFEEYSTSAFSKGESKEINGKYYPNDVTSFSEASSQGMYENTLYVYVAETSNITYGINIPTRYGNDNQRGHWVIWQDFELTRYDFKRTTAEGKLGTICLPYAATATGATAYTVALSEDKDRVLLTKAENMEAGKAYIYEATAAEQTFANQGNVLEAPVNDGILKGVFADTQAPVDSYVMQTKDGAQKFYLVGDGAQPTVGANKAYLALPQSSEARVLSIALEGDATAIDAVNALINGKAEIYDLNGRKLQSLQKGVNIVNGKKFIVK